LACRSSCFLTVLLNFLLALPIPTSFFKLLR
jgi:hypothetical protein